MNTQNNEGRFMVAVGAIIENTNTGKILLLKRSDTADFEPGTWEGLSGRIKQFEDHEDALHREVREETGLEIKIIKPVAVSHIFRGEQKAEKEVYLITFWCKTDSENVVISSEHSEYRWVTPEESLTIVKHPGVIKDIKAFITAYANI